MKLHHLASVLCLGLLPFWPGLARAGGSAPALTISRATPSATSAGVRAVDIAGSFNFDDLLQFSFPAGVIVSQGAHFVRFDLNGQVREGTSALVADGVVDVDVPPILPLGAAPAPPAQMTQLRVDRIGIVLPADFVAGPASVILYAVLESDPFVSNAVSVTLP